LVRGGLGQNTGGGFGENNRRFWSGMVMEDDFWVSSFSVVHQSRKFIVSRLNPNLDLDKNISSSVNNSSLDPTNPKK